MANFALLSLRTSSHLPQEQEMEELLALSLI
jgi:hypothetical protein